MTGVRSGTAILVDPGVQGVGIDVAALSVALGGPGTARTTLVAGLAGHPELLTGVVRKSAARRAVVVTTEFERPPISELRMWGEAGGLDPLGVRVVALDVLRARRSPEERLAYAVRMVRAAAAALDVAPAAQAVRRPVGTSLSRRALLRGRATTWAPVVDVDALACMGTLRCRRCVEACPQDALRIQDDSLDAPPALDASRCHACSGCLDVCPSGALSLDGHGPRTLSRQLRALLQGGDGAAVPSLVISCQDATEPLHHLGERDGLPGWLVLELPCLGGVGSAWHLAALAAGAPAVQVLPCERCMGRGTLTKELAFIRHLLTALGDVHAARRVGVLPARGLRLKRAVLAASGLTPLADATGADRIPAPCATDTPARVAAWAIGELRVAPGGGEQDESPGPRVILGEGAPLGVLRATGGCTACGVCARTCPTRALSLATGKENTQLVLDPAACTGCGVCVQTCPEGVLDVAAGVDLDLLDAGCHPIARVASASCPDCGESVLTLPVSVHLPPLPAGLAGRCPRCRQAVLTASAGAG